MAAPTFNLKQGQKAERKLLVTYVDVSGGHPDDGELWVPEWEIQGSGIEDSAVELNPDTETKTDILGVTETVINKLEESQTMEPFTIKGGSKLAEMLVDMNRRRATSEMQTFTIMRAYLFLGEEGEYTAHYDKNCTIYVTSIGGSGYVDIPCNLTYSGDRTHGTIDKLKDPTFVEAP